MLYKVKSLKGYKLNCIDGEIGKVDEFYFDDQHWAIRYLVADTGNWLDGRTVLISPYAMFAVIKDRQSIIIHLSKKQIEDSPSLETDKPVSRQFEDSYYNYYGWPSYWNGPYMWGFYPYILRDPDKWIQEVQEEKSWNPHLYSTKDVTGHFIQAKDGEIGHVEDFIIDDETWAIRYLVINTKNWWPGKKVLISPKWIDSINWNEAKVFIHLTRELIINSPEYSEDFLLTRDYETKLHKHYDKKGYWVEDDKNEK